MAEQVHQRFMSAEKGDMLTIDASEKSAKVLYRGDIRRVASDMTLKWSDADIENGIQFPLSIPGFYFVEILVTFVEESNSTTVTISADGAAEVVEANSAAGRVHLITVSVEVAE